MRSNNKSTCGRRSSAGGETVRAAKKCEKGGQKVGVSCRVQPVLIKGIN